jgi:probable DNA repair protein
MNGSPSEVDAWLSAGGIVVAASERAARALASRFHRARQSEGLSAWPSPAIFDWQAFLHFAWQDSVEYGVGDGRLLLDSLQEKSIWAKIAGSDSHMATLLDAPLNRIANLAMEAHKLICFYALKYLDQAARTGWLQDAENFSGWLAQFDETCHAGQLLSHSRLPLELLSRLQANPHAQRPSLLLAGFDRILPIQRSVFDAWGEWKHLAHAEPASDVRLYRVDDAQAEIVACVLWCMQQLEANPHANLLVLSQDLARRRGEIERAFLTHAAQRATTGDAPLFEFSLGVPLGKVPLARGAHLLLRWLSTPLAEHELDWLISSGQFALDDVESAALHQHMRALRQGGLERPQWSLNAFASQYKSLSLPRTVVTRMLDAQRRLNEHARVNRSPLEWAEFAPQLLQAIGWPGARPLSSAEFQSLRSWQQTVESCAGLGFDGQRIPWLEFVSVLGRALNETLFAPESRNAPIQIAGPAEAAGLAADAVWFMGADEDSWPAKGNMHPLLPVDVQRAAAMPHSTSQLDWDVSHAITTGLLASAPTVCFSYARQSEDAEARPSRLIVQLAGPAQELPADLTPRTTPALLAEFVTDSTRVPFDAGKVPGGAGVLTHQSQCSFKSFATARLAAQSWRTAEAGLTAAQRGQLLHATLHSIWGGSATKGIRTLAELRALADQTAFIAAHVYGALDLAIHPSIRERMPRGYLALEEQRLVRLIDEWLAYESTRVEFQVAETEARHTVKLAGLSFDLRLDRIDRLNDGTLLVIDYKTGQVTPKAWEPPRPDDVQLPLYAGFALDEEADLLGGLVFAKVRLGEQSFAGHVGDARATLFPNLSGTSALVKNPLSAEQIVEWKNLIETLAHDFLDGRANVDPRDYPKTCERCGLQTLCRVDETHILASDDEDGEATGEELADE